MRHMSPGGRGMCRHILACRLILGAACAIAQAPMSRGPEPVTADGVPLDLGTHAIPCAVDWNNDGIQDLVVGYRTADKVALCLNHGTPAAPDLAAPVNLQADGVDIHHASTGCGAPAPWVCDYDADGRKDLLVGAGATGYVHLYRNVGTDAAPILTDAGVLTVSGATLDVGIRATPFVYDWDEDGLDDLLCGDGDGLAHWFRNEGSAPLPMYSTDVLIQAGGTPVSFGYRSAVRVWDWDGDGLVDLLGSGSYTASWCRNVGASGSPVLQAPVRLRAPVPTGGLADIDTGYRMRLETADWNGDGLVDLLIGDDEGYVFAFESYRFRLAGITRNAQSEVTIEWQSADHLAYDVLRGSRPELMIAVALGIASDGNVTSWSDPIAGDARFYSVAVTDD